MTIEFSEKLVVPVNATREVNTDVLNVKLNPKNDAFIPQLKFDWNTTSFEG